MPTYIDIHQLQGATPEDLAKAHALDVETQQKYGVNYSKYWFNEKAGKVFCLVDAPNAEAAAHVHREAHGMAAEKIIEVQPDLVDGFLGNSEVNAAGAVLIPGGAADARDPGIRTIVFTDMVGSTTLTQRLGDEAAMDFLRLHDKIVRDALTASNGREVKHTGDGIMASFVSAAAAVRCAARIRHDLAHEMEGREHQIKVRIGGAAGEPVEQNDDIFGTTVQLAARLCAHAEPDQILVSNVVAELCIGKGLSFRCLGEVALKGFERPMQVHAVEWLSAGGAHSHSHE
jgi:class 3 adenylate cyclase